jgi:hypothetical protein
VAADRDVHEIPVLGQHHRDSLAGCRNDRMIAGVAEAEITDRDRVDGKRPPQPSGDLWGKVSVDPDVHAAMTG